MNEGGAREEFKKRDGMTVWPSGSVHSIFYVLGIPMIACIFIGGDVN